MEKLVFLADDHDAALRAVETLHAAGIEDSDISVIAKEGAQMQDLPDPALEDRGDALPAAARGAAVGGTMGLVAGLAAIAFPPAGLAIGGGAALAGAVGGASFGAFASSLIGVSVPNSQLRQYEEAVEAGRFLLVVEVADDRVEAARSTLHSSHPHVQFAGGNDATPPVL